MATFSLPRWLQSLVRAKPKTIRSLRRQLRLESLEDRITPSKTLIWDGGGSTNNWSDGANWNDPNNASIPGTGDDLVFPGGVAKTTANNDISNLIINSISFSGNNYTLGGNLGVTLGNGTSGSGYVIANSGSSNNTITFDITLGGSAGDRQFFTVGTIGATLTMSGKLIGTTGVELSKDGPGTLILKADNSGFTGPISIVEGPLNIQNAKALGSIGSPTTVLSTSQKSGQLQVQNVSGAINEPLFLNGPGPQNDGALLNVSGDNIWAGNVTLDSNATIGSNANSLTINGILSDTGAGHDLTKEGIAKLILDPINASGTPADSTGNTYRGETFVNNGFLTIRHSYALGNPTNSPTPVDPANNPFNLPLNDTVVNSATNRSGTLQLEFLTNAQRDAKNLPHNIDPNVNANNDGFTVPNELLTLNGPGVDGIHIRPKQPLAGQGGVQAGNQPVTGLPYTNGSTETGALNNLVGTNTWVQDIHLWSNDSSVLGDNVQWSFGGAVLPTVGIGAESGTTLMITGHIDDRFLTPTPTISAGPPPTVTPALTNVNYSLTKVRPGRVVLQNADFYRGKTEILEGFLNIRDSLALGAATLNNVNNGTFIFPDGTLELEADNIPDSTPGVTPPHGLTHLNTDLVITNENLRPMGDGAIDPVTGQRTGAIRNIRGVNEVTGNIQLQTRLPRNGVTFFGYGASFGVLPDYNMPNTSMFDRSQLTLSGVVGDDPQGGGTNSNLTKFGTGELVLTGDNTYTGRTFITEGWITARHDHALGSVNNGFTQTNGFGQLNVPTFADMPENKTPETYINQGAMLVLKQTRELVPQDINLVERIFVSGDGIDHPFGEPNLYSPSYKADGTLQDALVELNHNGAILNLSGNNTISGIVTLVGTATVAQIGIGADIDSTDSSVTQSSLAFSNLIRDDMDFTVTNQTATQSPAYPSIGNQTDTPGIYPYTIPAQPGAPAPNVYVPAGINKLGRKRVTLQGLGTFTGNNTVSDGVLRLQSDTALGMTTGTTTVGAHGAIELAGYNTVETKAPTQLSQYATSVIAFSSEFTASPGPWSSTQALGAPNTPTYGDISTAWSPLNQDGPPNPEFLTLGYTTPVYANAVSVRENLSNGFVTQIDLLDTNNVLHTVFGPGGVDTSPSNILADFVVSFPTTAYLVKGVKVYVDPTHVLGDWEEIDAVQLSGLTSLTSTTTLVNSFNGGLPGGIQVFETFVLGGLGNFQADNPSHNLDPNQNVQVDTLTSVSDDNQIRGPITLNSDITISSLTDSRFTLWKSIDGPGGMQKDGDGKLVLGGINTYLGNTLISKGIVNLQSSAALGGPTLSETQVIAVTGTNGSFTLNFNGSANTVPLAFNAPASTVQLALNALSTIGGAGGSVNVTLSGGVYTISFGGSLAGANVPAIGFGPTTGNTTAAHVPASERDGGTGGTTVLGGAQIEMQGDITIGGESLNIQGDGTATAPTIPLRWYAEGPGPITNTFWSGNAVTGRVTGVSSDPNDPSVVYLSAAGGGAWRSKDDGFTWQPLIDNINGVTVDQALFTGAIVVAPTDSNTIYVGLGESNNSGDSYYGRGILKSSDFGKTWTYIQPPGNAFDKHTISKIVVDPVEPDTIYVAIYGNGVNEGVGGSGNAANYGIWRMRNGTWVNLTAASTNPITTLTFDPTETYSDLAVFNANPFVTNGNSDGRHPNRPNDRIISFSIGDLFGSLNNAVYTSLDAAVTNNAPTWSIANFATTESNFPWRNGNIKLSGARVNGPGTNGAGRDLIVQYAAVTYPEDPTRGPNGQRTADMLRTDDGVRVESISYSTTTLQWSLGSWGTPSAQPVSGTTGFFPGAQGWYDLSIGMKSQMVETPGGRLYLGDPNFVFLSGVGSVFTPGPFVWNGGAWNDVDPGTDGKGPHVDYHAYTYDRTGHLIVGNDGGIWRMENATPPAAGAAVWTNLNQNDQAFPQAFPSFLQITTLNGVDVHPSNPFYAIGGAQDNGTFIYNDGAVWTDTQVGGDGGLVKINPKNPNIVFITTNGTLLRSLQGGAPGSFTTIYTTRAGSLYFPLIIDPVNPSRILIGDLDGNNRPALLESLDSDQPTPTFHVVGTATSTPNGLSRFGGLLSFGFTHGNQIGIANRQGPWTLDADFPLVVDQGAESYDSDTIYALTSKQQFNSPADPPGGVYVTKNHGQAWVRRNGTGGNTLPTSTGTYSDYSAITVDPRNRDVAYVVRAVFNGGPGGHVFATTDAAQNWTDISGNLPDVPVWSVAVNSRNGDVYVGTDNGLYRLPGGQGTTWERYGVGLPQVQVSGIVYNDLTNMLTVSTYGRGMFQMWLDDSQAHSGAIRAITGSSVWTGPVSITGNVDLRAETNAQINFVGQIADSTSGANFQINKVGGGRVVFSSANTYGGVTDVKEGALVVRNAGALGSSAPTGNTIVELGAALELQSDLALETVTVNGNGINFEGHNTGALRSVSNNNTFTGTLSLATPSTIGVDSGSVLTIGTKTGLPGVGTIDDGGSNKGITKELSGELILNSANTYGGLTDVVQGILQVAHGSALGSTASGTQVRNGAQLQMAGNVTVAGETLTLSGTGIFGTGSLQNFSGNNTWQGPVVFTGIQGIAAPPPPVPSAVINIGVVNAGETLTIDGPISETTVTIPANPPTVPSPVTLSSFGLTKVLPGKLILKGNSNNTYSGLTTVLQGVLNVQKSQALGTFAGAADGTVVVTGAALETEGGVTYTPETLTLNGRGVSAANLGALRNTHDNNTWTGPVILNSISSSTNPLINIGADAGSEVQTVTLGGVTTGTFSLTFNGQTATFNATDSAATVQAGLNALSSIGGVGGSVSVLLSGAVYTVTFGGTLANADQPALTASGFGGTTAVVNTVTDGFTSVLTVTGSVQDPSSVPSPNKAAELHKVGQGTIVFNDATTANSYQGRTFVDQGVLNIRTATALGTSGAATNDTTVMTGGTLQVQGGITLANEILTINGLGQNNQGALANNGGVNNWNGTVTLGSNAGVGANTTGADKLVINGQITDGSGTAFSITKVGPGTVEYAGNTSNTYRGTTFVNEGTLQLNKPNLAALPWTGGALVIGDNQPPGPPIPVDSAIVKIAATATTEQIPDATPVTVNADGLLDLNGKTETINGVTILNGHAKTGAGQLAINTSLNMTGGDVELGAAGNQLVFGTSAALTFTSSATETAQIHGGGGSVSLTPLTGSVAARTVTVNDGPQVVDLDVSAPIAGANAERLIKSGPGTMEIDSTSNTYTGTTEAKQGVLQIDGAIGTVELNGGTLSGTGTVGTVLSLAAAGSRVAPGDTVGTLHSGPVTWNGNTTFYVDLNRIQPYPNPIVAGTDNDQLQVTGNVDLGGATLDGTIDALAGSSGVILGDQFVILTYTGTRFNKFAQVGGQDVVFINNRKFTVSYDVTHAQNSIVPVGVQAVVLTKVKANVTVDITANPGLTTVYGQPVTFLITVNVNETGLPVNVTLPTSATITITFTTVDQDGVSHVYQSTQSLSNGQYLFDPQALFGAILGVGTHTVKADFRDPTNNFNGVDDPPQPGSNPTKTITETVNKGATTISLTSSSGSGNTSVYGAPVTMTAHIGIQLPAGQVAGTHIVTGTVDFTVDAGQPTEQHFNGKTVGFNGSEFVATFDLPGSPNFLAVGDHTVSAVYSGDNHYNGVPTTSNLVQHITKANSAVGIVAMVGGNPQNFSDLNQLVTFVVTVSSVSPSLGIPTGTVQIKDGANVFAQHQLDANGQWSFQISNLSVGTHTINVDYSGDLSFNVSSGSTQHTVRSNTTTTLVSSLNPSVYGQNVTFTATVTSPGNGTPTGTVDFFDGGNAIAGGTGINLNGSGVATFQISLLSAGSHAITAVYNGTTVFKTSSAVLSGPSPAPNQVVNVANTSTTLTASPANPTIYGQQITLTAQVAIVSPGGGTLTGTVDFLDNGVAIAGGAGVAINASGQATFQVTTLSAGTHSNITAHYNGTSNYNASNSNAVSRTINKANTTTVLASTVNPSVYGQAAITATVAAVLPGGGTPSGTVTFTITNLNNSTTTTQNVALDSNGVATLGALSPGNYSIVAAYAATTNYNGSSSNTIQQTVTKAGTNLALQSSHPPTAVYGEAVITATVTAQAPGAGLPSGTVTFHVTNTGNNSTQDYAANVNGVGVATLPTLDVGNYSITATYNGDTNFLISNAGPLAQAVTKATSSVGIASNHNPSVSGQSVTFTATISAVGPGSGTPTGTVDFVIDSVTVASAQPLTGGVATYTTSSLTVSGSPHTVQVVYSGSGNFFASNGALAGGQTVNQGSTNTTVVSSNNPALVGSQVTFTATVSAVSPASGIPTGTVDFIIDGSSAANVQLNGSGQATYQTSTLLQGTHTVVVHYNSDANFAAGDSSTLNQSVKGNTTTTVTSSQYTTRYGEQVTFTATVTPVAPALGAPAAGDQVSFVDLSTNTTLGTRSLNGFGQATIDVSTLPVGTHTIQATYLGSTTFFSSSGNITPSDQNVIKADTTTSVTQDSVTTVYGQQVIFTATIGVTAPGSGSPGGTANFVIDGTTTVNRPVANGVATLTTSTLGIGFHTIHVDYLGESNFNGSGGDLSPNHQVQKANTTTSVTSSLNPSVIAQTVTFTATINPVAPGAGQVGGTADFIIDNVIVGDDIPVTNGSSSFSISTLTAGSHTVQVSYNGDSHFNTSAGAMASNQVVNANPVVFAIVPSSVKSGAAFSVTVQYRNASNQPDPNFNGPVTLALNTGPTGGTLTGTLTRNAVNGVATFTGLKLNKAGNYTLRATANGLPPVISSTIKATASALIASISPTKPSINLPFTINLRAVDSTGAIATNYSGPFTLTIVAKPIGSTVSGPKSGTFSGGLGKLANLIVNKVGTYTFRINGPGGLTLTFSIAIAGRRAT